MGKWDLRATRELKVGRAQPANINDKYMIVLKKQLEKSKRGRSQSKDNYWMQIAEQKKAPGRYGTQNILKVQQMWSTRPEKIQHRLAMVTVNGDKRISVKTNF